MADFLLRLASLSAGGTLAILLLLAAVRLAGLRYAAKWRCLAWLLLCLRLAVPLSIPAASSAAPIRVELPADTVLYRPAVPSTPSAEPAPPAPADSPPEPQERNTPEKQKRPVRLSEALFILWALGAVSILGWAEIGHIRFLRYVRRWGESAGARETQACCEWRDTIGLRRAPRLLVCQGLQSPMLADVLRPCLLLPAERLDETVLRHALLHELTHYKRRDILFKLLALWVCALHWFNPAVWLMRRAAERRCSGTARRAAR